MANPALLEEALETFVFGLPAEGGGDYSALQYNIGDSGHLIVPRRGQADVEDSSEFVSALPGTEQVAEALGLPEGTRLILATSHLPSAVIAAVYGSEEREPLVPREASDYGWAASGEAWVDALLEPNNNPLDTDERIHISVPLGRVLLVDGAGFVPRPGMPGHFYKLHEGDIEAPESLDVSPREVIELAASGLVIWRDRQTSKI